MFSCSVTSIEGAMFARSFAKARQSASSRNLDPLILSPRLASVSSKAIFHFLITFFEAQLKTLDDSASPCLTLDSDILPRNLTKYSR